jgi:hypothetical protein
VNTLLVETGYTMPAATWLTAISTLVELGNGLSRYTRADVSSWPEYVDLEEDPTTGLEVTVTRTIVNRASPPTFGAGTPRYVNNIKWIDAYKGLQVKRMIHSDILTEEWEEFHGVKYYFPAYMEPSAPFSLLDDGAGNWVLTPNKSSDVNVTVPCRFLITYHTTPQVPDEIFQFKPVDLHLYSPQFRVLESDVLCDEGTLSFPLVDYGAPSIFHLEWALPASSPTATEFTGSLVGTEQLIADDCIRWNYNLYRRTRVYMKIPNFNLGLGASLSYY